MKRSLDPSRTYRRYLVDFGNYSSGTFRFFWLKRNALRHFEAHKQENSWASVTDTWTDSVVTRFNRQDRFVGRDRGSIETIVGGAALR